MRSWARGGPGTQLSVWGNARPVSGHVAAQRISNSFLPLRRGCVLSVLLLRSLGCGEKWTKSPGYVSDLPQGLCLGAFPVFSSRPSP